MNPILPQHTYDSFLRFERDIAGIVKNFPSATVIDPAPLSPQTYSCRIRDAINAFVQYDYSSHLFTASDLKPIFKCLRAGGRFIFTLHSNNTVICTDKSLTPAAGVKSTIPLVSLPLDGELDYNDTELFTAICVLKNRMLHLDPITVVNVSPSTALRITEQYPNIDITPMDDRRSLMT